MKKAKKKAKGGVRPVRSSNGVSNTAKKTRSNLSSKRNMGQVASGRAKSSIGVTPLGDRVIVMVGGKEENMSKFGIIIPETVDKERPDQGTVVAVGPGKFNEDGDERVPMSVSVGDKVIFSKYGPDEIKIGDKEYYVISESNILAVIG